MRLIAALVSLRSSRWNGYALLALVLAAGSHVASATTRTVTSLSDPTDSNGGVTLRQAIASAAVGDTIDFAVSGQIFLSSELGIARSLNIVYGGSTYVSIEGQRRTRLFNVSGGTVTITNVDLSEGAAFGENRAPGDTGNGGDGEGGAVFVGPSATVTLTHCTLFGNTATGGRAGKSNGQGARGGCGNGGAVANRGHLTLRNCYINSNTAKGGDGLDYDAGEANGGGVFNGGNGVLVMDGCTLDGNYAIGGPDPSTAGSTSAGRAQGGGFANGDFYSDTDSGYFTFTNCTFVGNTAVGGDVVDVVNSGEARGGAVYAYTRGSAQYLGTLTNCTLSGNSAHAGSNKDGAVLGYAGGGGLSAERGVVQLSNTIIARNYDLKRYQGQDESPDVEGNAIASEGYNFIAIGDGSSGSQWQQSDNIGTASTPLDPQFGDQRTYDITPVLTLKYTSAAIDGGNSPLTTDQRGAPRPVDQPGVQNAAGGNGSDIGAYEMRGPKTFVVTNAADSGAGSLRQAIADANDEGQPDSIVFNIPTTDPNYNPSTQKYLVLLSSGELSVTTPMSIDGRDAHIGIRRVGQGLFRIFNVSANGVTLANLHIFNGTDLGGPSTPGLGGGVLNSGGLTLFNCTLADNTATGGAGPAQIFQGLPGGEGLGGAIFNGGMLVMANCTLETNSAQGGAGGIGYSTFGTSARGGNGGYGRGGALFPFPPTTPLTPRPSAA